MVHGVPLEVVEDGYEEGEERACKPSRVSDAYACMLVCLRTKHRVHHDLDHKVDIERVKNKGDVGDAFACVHSGDRPEDCQRADAGWAEGQRTYSQAQPVLENVEEREEEELV